MGMEYHDVRMNGPYDWKRTAKYMFLWGNDPYDRIHTAKDLFWWGDDPYDRERTKTKKDFFWWKRLKTKIHFWTATYHGNFHRHEFLLAFHHLGLLDREYPDGNDRYGCSRACNGRHWETWRPLRILQVRTVVNLWGLQEATWEGSKRQILTGSASTSLRQVKEAHHRRG